MHEGQPEDFQVAVAEVLDLIKSQYDKKESLLQNFKRLAIASPVLSLQLNYSYKPKDIAFVQLFNLTLQEEEKVTYDHLWKVSDGYALVQDHIPLITKAGGELVNYRAITLLDDGLHDSSKRCLRYKLSSMAVPDQKLPSPRSNQADIDTFSVFSLSDTLNSKSSNENTPVDNCKLSSEWLIDLDNLPLHIPALQAKERQKFEAEAALTTVEWKSPRVIESKEEAIQSREAHLDEIERAITARVAELQARESNIDLNEQAVNTRMSAVMKGENDMEVRERKLLASWTQYSRLYSETQDLKTNLQERESDMNQRESSVVASETAIVELEESTRMKIGAELKYRVIDAESLEESITIRNAALKEREERLDEREQLVVVDRNALEVEHAKLLRHMDEVKIHEDMVKGAETLFKSREKTYARIRDEFTAREALIVEREAAIKLREDDARENHYAFFRPAGPVYTALGLVKEKQNQLNSETMAR
ncbi:hypothetical protein EAE96_002904 [Botrytis aclada]|nr:hypothetical protein EAE96_002904 [Botrytis aclada]